MLRISRTNSSKLKSRHVLTATVFSLVLAACSTQDQVAPSQAVPDSAAPGSVLPEGRDCAQDGNTLRVVNQQTVDSFDPDRSPGGTLLPVLMPAYDRLIHLDWTTLELIPGLAESWSFSDDGGVMELKLRPGVVFHDGEPFNAEAVAVNINRSQTLEDAFSQVKDAASAISRVEVVDDLTVRLHRNPAAAVAWSLLESRLTENLGMMISPAAITDDRSLADNPSGAGPWKIASFDRESVTLELFSDYWDDVERVCTLQILAPLDESALTSAIVTGDVSISLVPFSQVARLEADGNVEVQTEASTQVLNIYINHGRPNMQNRLLRQAFLYGIDRDSMLNALEGGNGGVTLQTFPAGFYAEAPGVDVEAYPYDPARARELVVAAGFGDGVVLEALVLEHFVDHWSVVQAQMAQVGVTINLNVVERSRWPEYLEGEYDLYMGRRARLDPLDILSNSLAADGFFNPGGVIPEIQLLLDRAAALTATERLGLVQEVSRIGTTEGYLHTLWSSNLSWATSTCVSGFRPPLAPTYAEFRGVTLNPNCS